MQPWANDRANLEPHKDQCVCEKEIVCVAVVATDSIEIGEVDAGKRPKAVERFSGRERPHRDIDSPSNGCLQHDTLCESFRKAFRTIPRLDISEVKKEKWDCSQLKEAGGLSTNHDSTSGELTNHNISIRVSDE